MNKYFFGLLLFLFVSPIYGLSLNIDAECYEDQADFDSDFDFTGIFKENYFVGDLIKNGTKHEKQIVQDMKEQGIEKNNSSKKRSFYLNKLNILKIALFIVILTYVVKRAADYVNNKRIKKIKSDSLNTTSDGSDIEFNNNKILESNGGTSA